MRILLLCLASLPAAELNIRTMDGLGRPLADVSVTVRCAHGREIAFRSDQAGMIRETYDDCAPSSVTVRKAGYLTYGMFGLRNEYVLTRSLGVQEVTTLLSASGSTLEYNVQEVLAGDFKREDIFRYEAKLRPILRKLATDKRFAVTARTLLALIAEPADLRRLLKLPPPVDADPDESLYSLTSSLIALPNDKAAQSFLRSSAEGRGWNANGSTLTLKLQRENLTGPDLTQLAERTARAIAAGEWHRNSAAVFNQAQDKALIEMTFIAGLDQLVYTATFHKTGKLWSLRAARETMQGMMPPPYVPAFEPPPQLKPQQP